MSDLISKTDFLDLFYVASAGQDKEFVEAVEMVVEDTPAVDAVEVVRCKDCKHYEIHKPKVLENCERNGGLIPMKPYDFCSYGERKGDDAVY